MSGAYGNFTCFSDNRFDKEKKGKDDSFCSIYFSWNFIRGGSDMNKKHKFVEAYLTIEASFLLPMALMSRRFCDG